MSAPSQEMLRMGELAEAPGGSAATIKHYLREGLLPEPVKTSRNMAWYPPEYVERLQTIKRLQEERYMQLRVIREVLGAGARVPRASLSTSLPDEVLDRLIEIGALSEDAGGFGPEDVRIIDAIARFR